MYTKKKNQFNVIKLFDDYRRVHESVPFFFAQFTMNDIQGFIQ